MPVIKNNDEQLIEKILINLKEGSGFLDKNMYSDHWLPYMRRKLDHFKNQKSWDNFRNNEISSALDNSNVTMVENKHAYSDKIKNIYSRIENQILPEYLPYLEENPIGNPFFVEIEGIRVSKSTLEYMLMLTHLTPYLEKCLTIVDIGGGYGGLSGMIKQAFPNIKCIILDLPGANAIQMYYLSKVFPNRKILTCIDLKIQNKPLHKISDFDFAILPGNCIQLLKPDSIDMYINTRSMMEMNHDIISFYFKNIKRTLRSKGYFYCLNRYEKFSILKYYPFGKRWNVALTSKWPAFIDSNPHHELILVKIDQNNPEINNLLRSMPPNSNLLNNKYSFAVKANINKIKKRVKNVFKLNPNFNKNNRGQ